MYIGRGAYDAVGRNSLDPDTELQDCRHFHRNKPSRSALLAPDGVEGSRKSFAVHSDLAWEKYIGKLDGQSIFPSFWR